MSSLVLSYAVQAFTVSHMVISSHQPDLGNTLMKTIVRWLVAIRKDVILCVRMGPILRTESVPLGEKIR